MNSTARVETQTRTWLSADDVLFSRQMETHAEQFFRRLGIAPRTLLLDVGCGAGQLALIAARAGAYVVACDIDGNSIHKARARAAAEDLWIIFEEGDAEALPYGDSQFDVVMSSFGAMFGPRPDLVAAELTRVCRPGGMIAMANWTPAGFFGKMFSVISNQLAALSMPAPVPWGDVAAVRDRLHEGIIVLKSALRVCRLEYPFPPEVVIDSYLETYGRASRAFTSLDVTGRERLRTELIRLWSAYNSSDIGTSIDAEYLEVIATRG